MRIIIWINKVYRNLKPMFALIHSARSGYSHWWLCRCWFSVLTTMMIAISEGMLKITSLSTYMIVLMRNMISATISSSICTIHWFMGHCHAYIGILGIATVLVHHYVLLRIVHSHIRRDWWRNSVCSTDSFWNWNNWLRPNQRNMMYEYM